MILSYAVLIGLLVGSIRAWVMKCALQIPHLNHLWIVAAAFVPQFFAFFLPMSRVWMPDRLVAVILIASQVLLLCFVWANRKQIGFWLLGLGLSLNLLVIASNGGFMPISPDTVQHLIPEAPAGSWDIGSRLGTGKDIVLTEDNTNFWWLTDRFLLPEEFPLRVAFSVGDLILAIGTIWFLGGMGAPGKSTLERMGKSNVPNIFAR